MDGPYDGAAERRRLKRRQLEEQLRLLDEEERSTRANHGSAAFPVLTNAVPTSSSSSALWTQGSGSNGVRYANHPLPANDYPLPIAESSRYNQYDPPARTTWPSVQDFATRPTSTTPPSRHSRPMPAQHPQAPIVPTSISTLSSQVDPSEQQVHEYLISQKHPKGLHTGWHVDGRPLDVYTLFSLVLRAGGSTEVTRRDLWPLIGALLNFPVTSSSAERSSVEHGRLLRHAFLQLLGGLEMMWEQTKTASVNGMSAPGDQGVVEASGRRRPHTPTQMTGAVPRRNGGRHAPSFVIDDPNTSVHQPPSARSSAQSHTMPTLSSLLQQGPPALKTAQQVSRRPPTSSNAGPPSLTQTRSPRHLSVSSQPFDTSLGRPAPSQIQTVDRPVQPPSRSLHDSQSISASSSHGGPLAPVPPMTQLRDSAPTVTPTLGSFEPPIVATFEELVASNLLPLPQPGVGVEAGSADPGARAYAHRCQELKAAVKKYMDKMPGRQLTAGEVQFWNKLVATLKRNPTIVIPGPAHFKYSNGSPATQPSQPLPGASAHVVASTVAPTSAASAPGTASQPKPRPGRPKSLQASPASSLTPAVTSTAAPALVAQPTHEPGPSTTGPQAVSANGSSGSPALAQATSSFIASSQIMVDADSSARGTDTPEKRPRGRPRIHPLKLDAEGNPIRRRPKPPVVDADGNPIPRRPKPPVLDADGNAIVKQPVGRPRKLPALDADGNVIEKPKKPRGRPPRPPNLDAEGNPIPKRPGPPTLYDANGNPIKRPRGRPPRNPDTLLTNNSPAGSSEVTPAGSSTVTPAGGSTVTPSDNPPRPTTTPAAEFLRLMQQARRTGSAQAPLSSTAPDTLAAAISALDRIPLDRPAQVVPGSVTASPALATVQATSKRPTPTGFLSGPSPSPRKILHLSTGPSLSARLRPNDTPTKVGGRPRLSDMVARTSSLAPRSDFALPVGMSESISRGTHRQTAPQSVSLAPTTALDVSSAPASSSASAAPRAKNGRATQPLPIMQLSRATRSQGSQSASITPTLPARPKNRKSMPARPLSLTRDKRRTRSASLVPTSSFGRPIFRTAHALSVTPVSAKSPLALAPNQRPAVRQSLQPTPKRKPPVPVKEPSPSPAPQLFRLVPYVEIPVRIVRKPKIKLLPVDRVKVVLPVHPATRRKLIEKGGYDAFRDDDSDDEVIEIRRAYAGLRPTKVQSYGVRTYRPTKPEEIPQRFLTRPGPALIEPWRSVLDPETLLKRAASRPCGWKGCDASMASEWHLKRHVDLRQHALQGRFANAGSSGGYLFRCHWRTCEGPCFTSSAELAQHMEARHISRVLDCPYEECHLGSPTISHLSRHVTKTHDEPYDAPRPLADLTQHLEPYHNLSDQPLPTAARSDEMLTPHVPGSTYRSSFRVEWVRQKVLDNSFAGENPIIHVEHPPHILEPLVEASEPISISTSMEREEFAEEERLLHRVLGKRKLMPFVEIPLPKRSRVDVGGSRLVPEADDVSAVSQVSEMPETSETMGESTITV